MENNALVPLSFDQMMQTAQVVASSKLFPGVATPEQAMTLMMLCRSEGIDPVQALRRYHIIQGRVTMRADAMQAEFQRQGGRIEWKQRDDSAAEAIFSHSAGGTITVRWDMDRAKVAGLAGKDTWRSYARQMLHARCVSEGVRAILPGVVMGVYTPEEVGDMSSPRLETAQVRHEMQRVDPKVVETIDSPVEVTRIVREPIDLFSEARQAFIKAALDNGRLPNGLKGEEKKAKIMSLLADVCRDQFIEQDAESLQCWQLAAEAMAKYKPTAAETNAIAGGL